MGNVVRYTPQPPRADSEILDAPPELEGIFARTPLLSYEDPKLYRALIKGLTRHIRPQDIIEWLLLKDVVDLTWEINRLCEIKPALLECGRRAAIANILAPVGHATSGDLKFNSSWDNAREQADLWADPKSRKRIEMGLRKRNLDPDSVTAAVSFSMQIPTFEAAEKILVALEHRRNNTLREIQERRL